MPRVAKDIKRENVIPGADNVGIIELIQGEQRNFDNTVYTPGSIISVNPLVKAPGASTVDITDWVLSAVAKYYKVSTLDGSPPDYEFGSLTDDSTNTPDKTLSVVKVDATAGTWKLVIPSDFYTDDIPVNSDTNLPIGIIYITAQTGATADTPDIRKFRVIVILRAS